MKAKLRSQSGLTITEMLCSVVVVLLLSGLVALGVRTAVHTYRASMASSQAQVLSSTLTTAISDKLRYCGTVKRNGGQIFIQDIGAVTGAEDGNVFHVDEESGELYLGDKKFLGSASYPEGLRVGAFEMEYSDDGLFTVSFQIESASGTVLASTDFQVRRINS